MNIWQIQQELLEVFNELEENDGELTEELEERLAISQENFKTKVEGYTNVIKQIKADIAAIDQESKRLAELKKSKSAVIERLTKILVPAIKQFGDISKSGASFVDYGTGKVSVRNSQKVELDEDKVGTISKELGKALAFEAIMGAGSNREQFTFEDIIQRCKEHREFVEAMNEEVVMSQEVTKDDISNTVVEITFKEPASALMQGEGYDIMKKLLQFNSCTILTPKIDKTQLKEELNSKNSNITIGTIVQNQSLTIK